MSSEDGNTVESSNSGKDSVASGGGTEIRRKNAHGNESNVDWKHGVVVDGNTRKIQCLYCNQVLSGSIYRLKHHLACTNKDVKPCPYVPEEVKKQMNEIVSELQVNLINKTRRLEEGESYTKDNIEKNSDSVGGVKRKGKEVETPNIFKRKNLTQATINSIAKKKLREEACLEIASFFYNNAIPFNVARSEEFNSMLEKVSHHGLEFKPPYHELRVKYLKQKVQSTMESLEEHKAFWKKTGCTIMIDGWIDNKRRTILNFLVNSPKGTVFLKSIDASHISNTAEKIFEMIDDVVEEVGEENVIQVVTENVANYKAAGEMLMQKRTKLYWTPCVAHCINLMLEDFEKKLDLHKETIAKGKRITTYIYSRNLLISLLQTHTKEANLVRPGMTRFATSYLTLGCLHTKKNALIRMFTSDQWKSSKFAKTGVGKFIEDVVSDRRFWRDIVYCLRGAYPLLYVLRLVDSDEKPAMGYIYKEMDRAKEKIQKAFQGVQKSYMPLWEIIDQRWDSQLHRPLHAAAYYLNPQLYYSPEFKIDYKVKKGLYDCLERMVGDTLEITKVDAQLEYFKSQSNFFGREIAKVALKTKTPAQWWDSYGDEHPELQRFAFRVLSLTCSSSRCERNWNAFEMVHSKRRNQLRQNTMNDIVFVMANSRLVKRRQSRKYVEYNIDDLDSDEEWIVEDEEDGLEDLENLDIPEDPNLAPDGVPPPSNDLEIPDFDEDKFDDLLQKDGNEDEGDHIEDNEFDDNLMDVL